MKASKLLLVLAASLITVAATAQTVSMEVNIPFAFRAGGALLPAGSYQVVPANNNPDNVILWNVYAKQSATVFAPPRLEPKLSGQPPRLVFRSYGTDNFLAQIWMDNSGRGLAQTKSESEITANGRSSEMVVLGPSSR